MCRYKIAINVGRGIRNYSVGGNGDEGCGDNRERRRVKLVSAAATRVRLSFKGTCVGTLVFLL